MSSLVTISTILFIVLGLFFLLIGSIGTVRLPDFYARTHATSKSDTLGLLLLLTGLMIYEGWTLNSGKLFLVQIFIALANPIGAHAIARAAYESGIKPYLTENVFEWWFSS